MEKIIIGTYQIQEDKAGNFWAKSLPFYTDLKKFPTMEKAKEYVNKQMRNRE